MNTYRGTLLLLLLGVLSFCPSKTLHAQSVGELRGKISDERGEVLSRARVMLVGTKLGGLTDLNGVFSIKNIPSGTYTVQVSYVGNEMEEISGVVIGEGIKRIDVVLRKKKGTVIEKTAKRNRGTEEHLLNVQKNSANVSNGISAAQIRKLPDATSGDALTRVTGISIVDKFINVRGANERYSNTQLNGVTLASTEPGKRAFSFDLVPSNLLENTVVTKTFTPDLPGDFSGGLVQLNTIDFPDQSVFRVALGLGYVGGTTFKDITLGPRGSSDFLGLDDGMRALPQGLPDTPRVDYNHFSDSAIAQYTQLFPNNFGVKPVNAAPNLNFVVSYGDRFQVLENDLGIVAALSYRNSYDATEIIRYDTTVGSEAKFNYTGTRNEYSVLWGGLLNLSYKLSDLHTLSIKNTYNHTAEDVFTKVEGPNYYFPADYKLYTFHYLEREFYTGQVNGDHLFPELGNIRLQWRSFASLGKRDEPDLRRLAYIRYDIGNTELPYLVGLSKTTTNPFGSGRVYSKLDEELLGFAGDLIIPIDLLKIKVGGLVENKLRNVSSRSFAYSTFLNSREDTTSVGEIFAQVAEDSISLIEVTQLSDKYDGQSHLRAGYIMVDLPFELAEQKFRVITGARLEDSKVIIHTVNSIGKPIVVENINTDWLPAASLIYSVTPDINLRLAFSKTVARPDFREFARFVFYDFILDALTYGNPDLERTLINNYDVRLEYFPGAGELVAISGFHKTLKNAIEEITLSGNSPERTWNNADGETSGIEFEIRKSFGFIAEALAPLSLNVNYTWLDSKIIIRDVDSTRNERRLQGQSPYLINAGLFYDNFETGTSVNLGYNRFGERINTVSRSLEPDLIEESRDRFDFSISQILFGMYEVRLSIKDILAQDKILRQFDRPSRIDRQQTSISLGLSFRL